MDEMVTSLMPLREVGTGAEDAPSYGYVKRSWLEEEPRYEGAWLP